MTLGKFREETANLSDDYELVMCIRAETGEIKDVGAIKDVQTTKTSHVDFRKEIYIFD